MASLDFFVIKSGENNPPLTKSHDKKVYNSWHDIKKQCESLKIEYKIEECTYNTLPLKSNNHFVCIINDSTLISNSYVLTLISLFNIHRDASLICGPVEVECDEDLNSILPYHINNFGLSYTFEIRDEPHNYPRFNNIAIPSYYYNLIGGYARLVTPRGHCQNHDFFKSLSELGPMVYCEKFSTLKTLTMGDLSEVSMCKTFYNYGYYHSYYNINSGKIENSLFSMKRNEKYKAHFQIGQLEAKTQTKLI